MSAAAYEHWRAHGGFFDLSDRAKLRLTGADRVRYLNGQVTANIKTLAPGHAIPACVTTAKGKLCADVFVTATEDALLIDAEAELREPLLARLERYIVADDVTIEDVTERFSLLHFAGQGAVAQALPALSAHATRVGSAGREFWFVEPRTPRDLISVGDGAIFHAVSPDLAELIRIEAGVPRWGRELNEDTLPPEAGLDRTHIDYAKGCYIGQEVISRIKSVGHVNRQLSGFLSTTGEPLESGWPLFAPGALEKPIGELTSAADSFALAKPVALGYLRRGSPTGALLAGPGGRVPVTPAELPLVRHLSSP